MCLQSGLSRSFNHETIEVLTMQQKRIGNCLIHFVFMFNKKVKKKQQLCFES